MDRQDKTRLFRILLNLVPQLGNIDVNIIGTSAILVWPHFGEDLLEGQYLSRVPDEINQQAEFGGCYLDPFAIYENIMPVKIDT